MDNSRFLKLRLREKYSVEELASLLDMPVDKIREIESDNAQPTAEELKKYALMFDVSVDYLIGMAEIPQTQVKKSAKSEKTSEKKAIFSRWWFLPFPVALLLMILFMVLPCYRVLGYNISLFNVFFGSDDGACVAIGVLFLIFTVLVACYSVVVMVLNNKTLAKMNLASAIVYGVFGICELIFVIVFNVYLGGTDFIQFCGVMSYIAWYAISAYAIGIGIYMLYRICNPKSDNNGKHEKLEDAQKIAEKKEQKAMSKAERKIQRENKLSSMAFMTKARFFMLISIPLAAIALLMSFIALFDQSYSNSALATACVGVQIGVWFLVVVFTIIFVSLNVKGRRKMIMPINILNALFVALPLIFGILLMCCGSGTGEVCGLIIAICGAVQSFVWLLNISKKEEKNQKQE